ncbi:hypothetical protein MYX75_12425, partial [Acidobacteria bacterium AH-259-A15]|nr:hypothetical protein [Acidobacteria bacterium AH-259-A15]
GKRPFEGDTVTETLAGILKGEPDLKALPENTPWRIRDLLRRCLQKDPHLRVQDVGDARIDIHEALTEPATVSPIGVTSAVQPARWKLAIPWSTAVVITLIAGVAIWSLTRPGQQRLARFVITPPATGLLAARSDPNVAISPDGSRIVYVGVHDGMTQLYVRPIDQLEATPIPNTERGHSPFFSPDSQWVGFFSDVDRTLRKISLTRGSSVTICDARGSHFGASWGDDDTIVFSSLASGLARVSASGGTAEVLTTPDAEKGEERHEFPAILPGGKGVLFTIRTGSGPANTRIAVLSLETGDQKILFEGGSGVHYAPTGHLVYGQEGTLWAVPFDLAQLESVGPPTPIFEGVMTTADGPAIFTFSREGSLVYIQGTGEIETTLLWVDRKGKEEPLATEPRNYSWPRVSPDGARLAIIVRDAGNRDVWIYDLARKTFTRLTFDPAADRFPIWTPDGLRVVFSSPRDGGQSNLFWKAADGTGPVERLTTSPNPQIPYSFSPDGKRLVFAQVNPETASDLHVLSMEGERTSKPLLQTQFNEYSPAISPDGRWISYHSNESGQYEVYVRPFPKVEEGKWQISSDGGHAPLWARQGLELFYRSVEVMMVVRIETEPTFRPGSPEILFTGRYSGRGRNYDISPDGQRFLMIKRGRQTEEASAPTQLIVVLNWFEELKRLVPTGE